MMQKRIIDISNFIIKIAFVFSFFALLFILLKIDVLPLKYLIIFIVISLFILTFDIIIDIFFENKNAIHINEYFKE